MNADLQSDLQSDLRSTTESIAADAERLRSIEEQKSRLEVGDPRLLTLSAEAEQIARRLVPKTAAESDLVALAEVGTSLHHPRGAVTEP